MVNRPDGSAGSPPNTERETQDENTMEQALEKLAERILSFDEASLVSLRDKYRQRIDHFDGTKEWEKAVIVYALINAVSMKNALFNENVKKGKRAGRAMDPGPSNPERPRLKRIK
jgi:hypothetical protein